MYAKTFLVAAALAPVALAQVTIDPFNFDCNQGQYGYGWNNGGNNNDQGLSLPEILEDFSDISSIFQNASLITRTAPTGNIPEIAQNLFDHFREAVCQTLALKDSLTEIRQTDNEQHGVCHAKSFYDLTLSNLLMNIEAQVAKLKTSFVDNNLPSIASCSQSLHDAYDQLTTETKKVAPICVPQQTTSSNLVGGILGTVTSLLGL